MIDRVWPNGMLELVLLSKDRTLPLDVPSLIISRRKIGMLWERLNHEQELDYAWARVYKLNQKWGGEYVV